MHVRIVRAFSFKNEHGETVTAPRGWIGDLPEDHGADAIKSGHAVAIHPRALPGAAEAEPEPDYEAMSRADLDALAAERKVDISAARNKGDVIAALKAA